MAHESLLADLERRRARAARMGGDEKLAKRKGRGQLNAQERLDLLVDPGTFVELGLLGASGVFRQDEPRTPRDGKIAGFAKIDGRDVGVVVNDFTVAGAVRGLVWGGLVRIFFVHHVTWSVNSVCHFFGRRRFDVDDHSTNVGWLAVLSLGESWHHNHHAFPRSAYHGLRWWEVDPSGLIIGAMQKLGLAWNVVRISPERQRARVAAGVA